jgi:predicted rRNA methylase
LRVQAGRPGLVAGPVAAAPAEVEGESHAPAAPADLIWGRHSALAALEAGRPLHRIWCTSELRFSPKFLQLLREAKASGVLLEEVTWARLGQISGGAVHQGIVLQPAAAATLQLDTLIEGCRQLGESPLLIAVDGLTDPQNLGAIVRSAEALGAHGLVLPQRRNAGLTGSVAKVAAGALEHLPVARVVNLNRSLDALKQEGYRVIGLAAEGTVTLEEADLSGPLVLVTGSEAEGLSLLTRRGCDQLVRIPLRGTTPSLNASVATALLLYEVARRSWMAGLRGTAPAPRLERPALPEPEPMTVSVSAAEAAEAAEPDAATEAEAAEAAKAAELDGVTEAEAAEAAKAAELDGVTEAEAAEAAEPDAATAEANGATAEADGAAVEAQGLAEEPNQALGSAGLAAVQVEAEGAAASIAQILEPSQPTEPTALGNPSALDQPPIPSTAPQDPSPWEPSPSPAPAANRELAADVPPDTGAMASPSTPSPLGEGVGEDEDEDEDEDDATAEEGIAASTQHTGGAPLELSTEAPPPAPLPSAAKIPDALVPEEFGQGSGAGEFDRADAGGAAAPSGQRGGIAASEHPLDGAEATATATAIPEEFATALASEGAETDPIAITTATGPSGQQPPAGTTLERSPEFNQDVSL